MAMVETRATGAPQPGEQLSEPLEVNVVEEDGLRKAINGYTWPGIEFGEPPKCAYTFFEYCDAIRFGDLPLFQEIEAACEGWYWPELDRGAGALLHIAADHGQLQAARFLIEQRGVNINQQDRAHGWTPLMRCARVAHYKDRPHMQLFEYLLQKGADASLCSFPVFPGAEPLDPTIYAPALLAPDLQGGHMGPLEVAAQKGFGWQRGEVRARLAALVERYADVAKQLPSVYRGPFEGEFARKLVAAWESLPKLYPPQNWSLPPPAGFEGAAGIRRVSQEGWRPAGEDDGSGWLRPLTAEEKEEWSRTC